MKKNQNNSKSILAKVSLVCLLTVLLSGCIKDNNIAATAPSASLVSFAQTSPDQVPVDLFFNANSITTFPIKYGNVLNYFTAYAGKRVVNIYNDATTVKILSDSITLTANKSYSIYLANTAAKAEIVLLRDSLVKPDAGKGTIRFVNLGPDAGAVDLAIKDSAAFVTNKAYKEYSAFVPVTGGKNYNFEVRKAGTTTVLASLTNISINSGYVYTINLQGLVNTTVTTQKPAAVIFTNGYSL